MLVAVKFKKLDPRFELPKQATPGASGFDVRYVGDNDLLIMPHHTALIPLGCAVEVP
jgi:dUTPase